MVMVGAVVNGSRRPRDKSTATAARPPPPLCLGKVENCKVNHCKVEHSKVHCKVDCKVKHYKVDLSPTTTAAGQGGALQGALQGGALPRLLLLPTALGQGGAEFG